MGTKISVGCQEIEIHINHPKIQNAKIYTQNSVSKLIFQIPTEENVFKLWKNRLKQNQFNNDFLFLPEESIYLKSGLCSTHGIAKVIATIKFRLYIKIFHISLKTKYMTGDFFFYLERAGKKQHFAQEDIWYLLYSIFSAKKQLKEKSFNQENIGIIKLQNIFLSESQQIKIACSLSWPESNQLLLKDFLNFQTPNQTPEDWVQVQIKDLHFQKQKFSELIAIGLTLLSVLILKDCQDLFDYQNKMFNFKQFASRFERLRTSDRYSDILITIIEKLCSIDPTQTLKSQEIEEILFKHKDSILSKKKFLIDSLPQKIEKRIKNYHTQKQFLFDQSFQQSQNFIEIVPQKNSYDKDINLRKNSLNLTQVILGNQNKSFEKSKISDCQSLYSSVDQVQIKRTHSQQNLGKPLERYQQINANIDKGSLFEMDSLDLIDFAKQIIAQKPIIIDTKRKSNDIEEESTPISTPKEGSIIQKKQKRMTKTLQIPRTNVNFVQKYSLSKTTNLTLNSKPSFEDNNLLKVMSAKSYDEPKKQDFAKNLKSSFTMYIPLMTNLQQFQSSTNKEKKMLSSLNEHKSFPEMISQNSKQCSQVQVNN